jgi:4-hydroxybenzoate polyprenyltransferase
LKLQVTENFTPSSRQWPGISGTIRAAEWWGYKFAPIFAIAYATVYTLRVPLLSLWPLFVLALAALAPCAAYVSVINDLTDLNDDLASGKVNRLVGKSRAFVTSVLACSVLSGLAVAIYLRSEPLLLSLYLGAWTAFTFYSLPPIRLKRRGVFGLLADAAGAHLFPTLFAVCLVYRWCLQPIDRLWFAAVAVWSLTFGVRGILWHQLTDIDNDEKIGLRTFARRHRLTRLRMLGDFVVFPTELCALAVIVWRVNSHIPLAALFIYALLEFARANLWRVNLIVVVPKPKFQILMLEYYELFFPLAVVLSSSMRYSADAIMAAAHIALFPRRPAQTLKDCVQFIKGAWRRIF